MKALNKALKNLARVIIAYPKSVLALCLVICAFLCANISKLEKNIMDKIKKIMISKYKIKSFDF